MKSLLILRHAKTQSDAPHGDFARDLVERGLHDATLIGQFIRDAIGRPDLIVTSDAVRAAHTADLVNAEFETAIELVRDHRIYDADVDDLVAVVQSLPDDRERVLLVGHNPGFEDLVGALVGPANAPEKLPTAGLAVIDIDVPTWPAVGQRTGRLTAYTTPKLLR